MEERFIITPYGDNCKYLCFRIGDHNFYEYDKAETLPKGTYELIFLSQKEAVEFIQRYNLQEKYHSQKMWVNPEFHKDVFFEK